MSLPYPNPPAKGAHWVVHLLHAHLRAEGISRVELAKRAGLNSATLEAWWYGRQHMHIANVEAALGVFGLELKPVFTSKPAKKAIPVGTGRKKAMDAAGKLAHAHPPRVDP